MKIRRIFSVFLLSVLLATLFLTPQAYALEEPTLDARNALLMDETNGRMLYGKAEKEKAYPASITKVMTALLVLEAVDRGDLSVSQPITASYEAANSIDEDSSTAGIEEGEVLTVEQLLYCLLVVSANEAANILAEAVSGSITDFVSLMNQRAAELGWIKGFEDGTFRPDTYITRAQAMTMINRVLNRIPEEESDLLTGMNVWPDCNPGDWFYLAVQEATNSHDFKHKAGNYEIWTGMNKNPDWTRYEN